MEEFIRRVIQVTNLLIAVAIFCFNARAAHEAEATGLAPDHAIKTDGGVLVTLLTDPRQRASEGLRRRSSFVGG